MVIGLVPVWQIEARAASYNASAALAYAAAHWNDSCSQHGSTDCAHFVSQCINAGGCSSSSASGSRLHNLLEQSGMGTFYDLQLIYSGGRVYIKASDYKGKLEPGDVVQFYCPSCASRDGLPYIHTVLCNGMDGDGYMKAYSHTSNNPGTSKYSYGQKCWSTGCGGTVSKAVVFHFNGNSGSSGSSTSLTLSNATVPTAVKQGDAFSIYGTISSNYKINYAAVIIMDLNRNSIIEKQVAPGTYS